MKIRRSLGLLGFGRIAQGVARVASAGLGMRVLAYSPRADSGHAQHIGVELVPSAAALFAACTHVSVHCALSEETRDSVGAALLALGAAHERRPGKTFSENAASP